MKTLFPFATTQTTDKIAKSFINEARNAYQIAQVEVQFGELAGTSYQDNENPNLAAISVWHYEQGLKHLLAAINCLEQARKFYLSEKYKNYVEMKLDECQKKVRFSKEEKTKIESLLIKDEEMSQKGFSLIELIIVVLIIGIIATLAIPNLLSSRRAANEASAIASLRTYHSAQLIYQATTGSGNFAGDNTLTSSSFTTLRDNGILDSVLGSATKSGYRFAGIQYGAAALPAQFGGRATPVTPSGITATGRRDFSMLTDGVMYSGAAGAINITLNSTQALTQSGGTPMNN